MFNLPEAAAEHVRHSDSGEDFSEEFGIKVGDNLDDLLLPHHHREAIDLLIGQPRRRYP
jgi:hypothetical protein